MDRIDQAANFLVQMRLAKRKEPFLPVDIVPRTIEEGYQIQDRYLQLLQTHLGGQPIGYKVAATNVIAQKIMDVDGPFFGVLLSPTSHARSANLNPADFTVRCMEPEFGFTVGRDLPTDCFHTAASVTEYMASIHASLEIVDHRFHDWKTVGAPSLIADNAIHGAWIIGEPIHDWQHLDLASHPVEMFVNGKLNQTGSGAAVLGNPLNVVAWLANELQRFGKKLCAGDRITTGTTADVYLANPSDHIVADFGILGSVEARFT
jgi:2-keto-4-pentenoate hydratase